MTRIIFGQYISYLAIAVFSWILTGQLLQSNLATNQLIRINGIIDTTTEVEFHEAKSNHESHDLRIYLRDTTEYFRFMDIYKYEQFRGLIHKGDTVEIYIRPKWLIPLGLGYKNDIFQMTVNGVQIFDVSQTKREANGIIIISIIAIPLFIILGLVNKRMRRKIKAAANKQYLQKTGGQL